MKFKLCLVALALSLGLTIAWPTAVLASDTNTQDVDKRSSCKNGDEKYQAALDKWNKLTDKQKKEVYDILKNKEKTDIELLNKLSQLGVLDKTEATMMQAVLEKMYDNMIEKGEFPIMRPRGQMNR